MTVSQAIAVLGVNRKTLDRWRERGYLRHNKAPNGRIYYYDEDVYAMVGKRLPKKDREVACYVRVNKDNQPSQEKIATQLRSIQTFAERHGYPVKRVYKDIAPSTEGTGRPDYGRLVEDILDKQISLVIADSTCRISRFGYYEFERLCAYSGVKILILKPVLPDPFYKAELKDDLTTVLMEQNISSLSEVNTTE